MYPSHLDGIRLEEICGREMVYRSQEREHLSNACDDFETRIKVVYHDLEKVTPLQTFLSRGHHRIEERVSHQEQLISGMSSHSSHVIPLGSFLHYESVKHTVD